MTDIDRVKDTGIIANTHFTYDPYGNVANVRDPQGNITTYDPRFRRYPEIVTAPPVGEMTFETVTCYDDRMRPVKTIGPNGNHSGDAAARCLANACGSPGVTCQGYDAFNRVKYMANLGDTLSDPTQRFDYNEQYRYILSLCKDGPTTMTVTDGFGAVVQTSTVDVAPPGGYTHWRKTYIWRYVNAADHATVQVTSAVVRSPNDHFDRPRTPPTQDVQVTRSFLDAEQGRVTETTNAPSSRMRWAASLPTRPPSITNLSKTPMAAKRTAISTGPANCSRSTTRIWAPGTIISTI